MLGNSLEFRGIRAALCHAELVCRGPAVPARSRTGAVNRVRQAGGAGMKGFGRAVGCAAIAVAGLAPVAGASFIGVTLGQAGPSGLNLGVFVTGPTVFSAS